MHACNRIFTGLVALTVAVVLAGCASSPTASTDAKPLRVGTSADYPPVVYAEGDEVMGIEVDFAEMAGKRLGRPVEIVRLPFDSLIDSLTAGEIDVIMSGMTHTPERAKRVAFTDSYMTVILAALVRAEDAGKYLNDLDVKKAEGRVAAQPGTTAAEYMKTYCFGAKEKLHLEPSEAPAALLSGDVDMYLHDSPAIDWLLSANSNTLAAVKVGLMRQDLAWAVRKADRGLWRSLNGLIRDGRKDGSLTAPLQRWVPQSLSEEENARSVGLARCILFLGFEGPEDMGSKTVDVMIDGEIRHQWELKDKVWFANYVAPGERTVRLVVEGFEPIEKVLTLRPGSALWEKSTLVPAAADTK